MPLSDTWVAAVLVIQVFNSTYNTHRSHSSPCFLCNTHNASVLPVAVLSARLVLSLKGLSDGFVIPSVEWWIISVKLFMITRNACRRCRACWGFHTDIGWCRKTVERTGCFSRTSSPRSVTVPYIFHKNYAFTCARVGKRHGPAV